MPVMAIIRFYDATEHDRAQIQGMIGKDHDLDFVVDHLDDDNLDPQTEIISMFVGSQISAQMIEKMPKLKLIACRSTGYNNVDVEAAKKRNVKIATVPAYGEHTVAEYSFGLMLALSRRLVEASAALKQGHTDHNQLIGHDLHAKTLGVVGAGKIGRQVAAIGKGFGMKVLAYDEKPQPDLAKEIGYDYTELDNLLSQADVISLHLPALDSTNHLMNARRLALAKPSALLINTSRGAVVDTAALIEALESDKLAGAALDVFEGEALAEIDEELRMLKAKQVDKQALQQAAQIHVLANMPNVVLTNHNAYNTIEAIGRINETTAQNITSFLAGQPQNIVGQG